MVGKDRGIHAGSDDVVLLKQVAGGKAEALSELYDRYNRLVYSLAIHVVGNVHQAEEITQDVFVQLWNKAGTYQADLGKVSTWLVSVTRNRAIDVLRRQQVRPEGHQVFLADGISPDLQDGNDLEETIEVTLQKRRVREALDRLPIDQQHVLALAYFQGYSHQEIANAIDQPLGTVKTRLRLAMQKLKQYLVDEVISAG